MRLVSDSRSRVVSIVAATVVAALLPSLAGCVGRTSGGDAANGKTTIRFVGAQQTGYYDAIINAFEKKHPNIDVQYQSVPFAQFNPSLQARLGSKDPTIDLYTADEPRIPSLVHSGFLEPLDQLASETRQKVSKEAFEATTWQGRLYALPLWTSTMLLFYNKDLLEKAHVKAPSSNPAQRITWERLVADAKKTQRAGAEYGFTFEQVDLYYQLQPLVESAAGGTGLAGEDSLKPAVTTAGWVKAMGFYHDLFADKVAPRGIPFTQMPQLFADGKVAYFEGNVTNFPVFVEAEHLNFGLAAVPYFAGGRAMTPTDSWSIGVSPFSKHKQEAIEFAKFMTLDDEGAILASKDIARPPVNKAAYEHWLTLLDQKGSRLAHARELVTYELSHTAVHRPRSIGYIDFETIIGKAFADIRNGSDAHNRLVQAQQELQHAFQRY
jgi:ABC-type glycerol-3-phosphate transport system substrate-binding protein